MDRGRIVFQGTPDELTARGEGTTRGRRRSAGARLQRGAGAGPVMTAATATRRPSGRAALTTGAPAAAPGAAPQRDARDAAVRRRRCSGSSRTGAASPRLRCGTSGRWACRAPTIAVFIPTVVGAAAWMGAREARRGLTDLLAGTARPRWARQLATWAAATGWALAGLPGLRGCPLRGHRRAGRAGAVHCGGRRWSAPRACRPCPRSGSPPGRCAPAGSPRRWPRSRAFLVLEISLQFIHGGRVVLADLAAGRRALGSRDLRGRGDVLPVPARSGHRPADLPRRPHRGAARASLGLPAGAGGRGLRRSAAAITAVGLAGGRRRRRAGRHRPARPARHDRHPAAAQRGRRPSGPLHPGLPADRDPGLPAPGLHRLPAGGGDRASHRCSPRWPACPGRRCASARPPWRQDQDGGADAGVARSDSDPAARAEYRLVLPNQVPGPADLRRLGGRGAHHPGRDIVASVIGDGSDPAQRAVLAALLYTTGVEPSPPTDPAAARFAALAPAVPARLARAAPEPTCGPARSAWSNCRDPGDGAAGSAAPVQPPGRRPPSRSSRPCGACCGSRCTGPGTPTGRCSCRCCRDRLRRGHRRRHGEPVRRARAGHRPLAAVPAAGYDAGADRRRGRRPGRRRYRGNSGRRPAGGAAQRGRAGRSRPAGREPARWRAGLDRPDHVHGRRAVRRLHPVARPALTSPWLWPARPPHDTGAAICAGLVLLSGLVVITVRGARDPVGEE